MPVITFNPSGKSAIIPNNTSLLEAAKQASVSIETPCGGNGLCKKCLVKITSGKVKFENNGALPNELINEGYVLICRAFAADEPVNVEILSLLEKEKGKFTEASEDIHLIDKTLLPAEKDISPLVKKISLKVSAPESGDGLSDYDRFTKAASDAFNNSKIELSLTSLKKLPQELRADEGNVIVAFLERNGIINIVDITAQCDGAEDYGVAVDIGTTTVAVQLVDMKTSHIIASKIDYNRQIECGLDVISRINYAKKPERLEELRQKVLSTINGLLDFICAANKINSGSIYNISIAGNTVMVHLLLGIYPDYIRLSPYTPAVYNVPYYKAGEIGINVSTEAYAFIAPSVGSYVGGDITSGLLCTSLATASDEPCLFIDIGTNGEIIIGNNDFLIGCACSAGPAFEGGGIENGMRASNGAIERVEIDKETGKATYAVIGGTAPSGICGSGLISLIAGLFETGWLDAAGKLKKDKNCLSIEVNGKYARYIIAQSQEAASGNPVYINEFDIENLIRAKAAIFSACVVMLKKVELDFGSLSKIFIAGGFGRYLNIEKASDIGLIPKLDPKKFVFIGNSSLTGAYMTLLSSKHRELQQELAKKITYLDLSVEPEYMNEYTAAMFLPHTDFSAYCFI